MHVKAATCRTSNLTKGIHQQGSAQIICEKVVNQKKPDCLFTFCPPHIYKRPRIEVVIPGPSMKI